MDWNQLATDILNGYELTIDEGLEILNSDDSEILSILHAAYMIRKSYFGKKVKLNMILNAKSGSCSENCGYCSQSSESNAPIEKYRFVSKEDLVRGAEEAIAKKANTYCIVASGRGPTTSELETVAEAIKEIKEKYDIKICTSLGLISAEQALRLKDVGIDRYNHNLNTSKEHYGKIATSHTYDNRVDTIKILKEAGISPCSGVIIGMKETKEDIVKVANSIKLLDPESIPINFLNSVKGTRFEDVKELTPVYCLKVLALYRFINPTKEIRISGGREINLRSLQPLGLYAANSIFVGDYLTTEGQAVNKDHEMIVDLGFEIEITHEIQKYIKEEINI
ncbi:MAG: bioB [Bacillales bacterium]|jgi:biotin synthase|nr:bioB [Bacillales bacterium]